MEQFQIEPSYIEGEVLISSRMLITAPNQNVCVQWDKLKRCKLKLLISVPCICKINKQGYNLPEKKNT